MATYIAIGLALIFQDVAAFGFTSQWSRNLFSRHALQLRDNAKIWPSQLSSQQHEESEVASSSPPSKWTHADIEWRLSPPPETPVFQKLKIKAAAKAIRAECLLKDQPVPPILCPKGGKAELEGYKDGKKIAKFGITTTRGPSAPQIDETIQEIYGIDTTTRYIGGAGIGAIIYMFVESEYRSLGIGELALEAIASIQTVQNCDFTVLVADDDGSGKLIKWYEENGFTVAPKLQDLFGSSGGDFGKTMISPTSVRSNIFADCKIKWW